MGTIFSILEFKYFTQVCMLSVLLIIILIIFLIFKKGSDSSKSVKLFEHVGNELKNVLWKGKIKIKRGIFYSSLYCTVTSEKLSFYKFKRNKLVEQYGVLAKDIISLDYPSFGSFNLLIKGYEGIRIRFNDNGKNRTLHFWADGIDFIPDQRKMDELISAISKLTNTKIPEEQVAQSKTLNCLNCILLFIGVVISYFTGGFLGVLILYIGIALSTHIYFYSKIDKPLRVALILLIIVLSYAIPFLFSILYFALVNFI